MSQYIDFGFSVLQTSVYGSRFYVRDDSSVTPTRIAVGVVDLKKKNKERERKEIVKHKQINVHCLMCKKILKLTLGGEWREEGLKKDNILLLLSLIK